MVYNNKMWNTVLNVNSILWALAGTYFFYAVVASILFLSWKIVLIAALTWAALTVTEIMLAALE